MKTSLVERQLLLSAKSGDLGSIIMIVKGLTPHEKTAIGPTVLDTLVNCINNHAQIDRVESAYTMMMFVREMGAYLPATAMGTLLGDAPAAAKKAGNVIHLQASAV